MRRRNFLGALGASLATFPATNALATARKKRKLVVADLRGSIDVSKFGVKPGVYDDQSRLLQRVLDQASNEDKPVFLPSGTYVVSNLDLPARTRLIGIPGASRLIYGGGGTMLNATACEVLHLESLVLDGANRTLGDPLSGLLHARACPSIVIDRCEIIGSQAIGLSLDTCGGRIERCSVSGAGGLAGLYSVNATGLAIRDNHVADCANGGILVHRWTAGEDNTLVSGNRIERIAASDGGTGQHGNGINLFRTAGVIVSNNHLSDCAFSAIRANTASNVQISGNTCLRSGETAIYSEFAFQGSSITNNLVDGAAVGISIANFNEGGRLAICANNLVRNLTSKGPYPAENAGFGIGIYAEADTSITGNVIEDAPQYGMLLGWGPYLRNVNVAGNIIRKAGEGIAVSVVKGASSTTITGNIIAGARNGAIIGHEWTRAVTQNLAGKRARRFSHLTIAGNVVS